ncbi:hypothetical protein Ccrd_002013 [Cynara cardunculus var. scolymus]|uniref:non-specific serine/threonine protein kinase n=1 Tax=Cynara cardunculus var. scolymus TaxID=59895 RepID=A0A118JWR7_CYNCS|nr:hypothetical protein Ccrd_002013 [Cynara cardunculus var. scolymus]
MAVQGDASMAVEVDIQEIVHHESSTIVDHRPPLPKIQIDIGKLEHLVVFSNRQSSSESRDTSIEIASYGGVPSLLGVLHLEWDWLYTLRELGAATNGLSVENVIEEGGYGIVYSGVLGDEWVVGESGR